MGPRTLETAIAEAELSARRGRRHIDAQAIAVSKARPGRQRQAAIGVFDALATSQENLETHLRELKRRAFESSATSSRSKTARV